MPSLEDNLVRTDCRYHQLRKERKIAYVITEALLYKRSAPLVDTFEYLLPAAQPPKEMPRLRK